MTEMTEAEALKIAIAWGKARCALYQQNRTIFDDQYIIQNDRQALDILYRMLLEREAAEVKAEKGLR